MKILQLDLGREWRGGQRQVLYLLRHLAASEGFVPLLAVPAGAPLAARAREAGIAMHELPGRFEWHPLSIGRLCRLVRREGVDVVHTHCARSASLGAVVKLLTGVRLVHSRRVSYPLGGGWSRRKYLLADAVPCVSREIGVVVEMGGVSPEKVHTIHSGIDPGLYAAAALVPPPSAPVYGLVGALTRQKGHTVFLDALAELDRRGTVHGWRAVIAGKGPLADELRDRAVELGIRERVEFAGYRESVRVLPEVSVLVVPSVDGEGSSAVIKEGWAVGRPVVCSALPSNLELVESGVSGLAFETRNPGALADTLELLYAEGGDDLARGLVRGGQERLAAFTHEAMARANMALYESL